MSRDLDEWLEHLAGVRRVSPQTVRSYRVGVGQYVAHLRRDGRRARRARPCDVESFCASLQGSPATISQRMYAVRSFHRWLHDTKRAKTNPAAAVRVPSVPEALSTSPTAAAIQRILDAHGATARGVRDRAIVSMLYGCGLRVSELLHLGLDDVDLDARRMTVTGKGRKRRLVPIPNGTMDDLRAWLALRDDELSPYVFPGRSRAGMRTQEAVYAALKNAARRAGVDPARIHPHALRHAFATHLHARGVSLQRIQRLLGHSNIATTCKYLATAIEDLTDAVDAHHPLALLIPPREPAAVPWSNWLRAG